MTTTAVSDCHDDWNRNDDCDVYYDYNCHCDYDYNCYDDCNLVMMTVTYDN